MRGNQERRSGVSGAVRPSRDRDAADPEALARRLEELEARVARLEASRPVLSEDSAPPIPPLVTGAIDEVQTSGPLALAGRTLIALGGGYLLRMVTSVGGLAPAAGAALGLAYAAAWTIEADREARRGRTLPAALASGTSALLAYPLLWEASTRFGALSGRAALAIAVAFVLFAGAVGLRRDRPSFGWLHVAPAVLLAFALLFQEHDTVAVVAAMVALHAAAEGVAVRDDWRGMRWLTGAAAATLAVGVVSVPSPPATIAGVALVSAAILAAAMARAARRPADAFDLAGGAAALALAVIASAALPGAMRAWPAAAGLLLAAAGFAGAARAVAARVSARALALAATALALAASAVLLPPDVRVLAWCAAAIALAGRSPSAMPWRATVFTLLLAALAASGALTVAARGILGFGDGGGLGLAGAAAAVAAVAVFLVEAWRDTARVVRLGDAAAGALGLVALATGGWPSPELAAALGTGALSLLAAAAALAARGKDAPALRALSWAVFAAGGLRLLLVDLHDGRPLTLFIALVSYGAALLAAQAARSRGPARARA